MIAKGSTCFGVDDGDGAGSWYAPCGLTVGPLSKMFARTVLSYLRAVMSALTPLCRARDQNSTLSSKSL